MAKFRSSFSLVKTSSAWMLALMMGGVALPLPSLGQSSEAEETLAKIEQDYFNTIFLENPVLATQSGVHQLDGRNLDAELNNVSESAIREMIFRLGTVRAALQKISLPADQKLRKDDRQALLRDIDKNLVFLIDIQSQTHNPNYYIEIATEGLDSLISRNFAPLSERLEDVIARENAFAKFFRTAASNLEDVPVVFIEVAKENLAGAESFVRDDVPKAFTSITNKRLKSRFHASTQNALKALEEYRRAILKIKPQGSYAIGREALEKLLASDMANASIETLIAKGEAQLKKDQEAFDKAAAELSPQDPEKALEIVRKDHVAEERIYDLARAQLKEAQAFLLKRKIVTLPAKTLPVVRPTLPFERSMITAAMSWPGAFETKAKASYYYITAPNPKDPQSKQLQDIEDLNTPMMRNITVHEAMPGHYIQGLYLHTHPQWSLTRKGVESYPTTEGWAHYAEQMMLDQGFYAKDAKYRLVVAQDALLRDCRFLVSLKMHSGEIGVQQGADMMEQQCHQSHSMAYKEARRGAEDPGYYAYLLGKMQIEAYKEAEEKRLGKHFSLQKFHDHILASGLIPLPLIAQEPY